MVSALLRFSYEHGHKTTRGKDAWHARHLQAQRMIGWLPSMAMGIERDFGLAGAELSSQVVQVHLRLRLRLRLPAQHIISHLETRLRALT